MALVATKYYKNYDGGLNDTASSRDVKENESPVLHDWDITYQGQLRRRAGLTVNGGTIGINPIEGLHAFLQSNGGRDLLCFEGTNLRFLNSTTFDILDDGFIQGNKLWMETVASLDRVYLSNQDNTLHYWDRSSTILNSCLVDLGSSVPSGNVMRWHKNHLFHINNVKVDGNEYQHDIFWSNLGDPNTYDTVNNHFSVPGNGRAISIIDLGDYLMIFKERSLQFLSGWGSDSWQITSSSSNVANLDEQVGMIAPYGATRYGNEVWFIDNEGIIRRIYQTDQNNNRHEVVSNKIQTTLARLNKGSIAQTVAWTHNNKVYFSIPVDTNTNNNLVLVHDMIASKRTQEEAWTIYTGWYPSLFASFPNNITPDLYIGDNRTGMVYLNFGISDNGVAIDARRDGKVDDFGKFDLTKRYIFGEVSGSAPSDSQVDMYVAVDQSAFATVEPLVMRSSGSRLGPTGSFQLGPTGGARLAGRSQSSSKFYFSTGGGNVFGNLVQTSIRHNRLNEQPIVSQHVIHFKQRDLHR